MARWDAIVVGGGAMGTSAARHLAGMGCSTLLLERFEVGHHRGSSHGATRIFRLSYHRPEYVRMARRALLEWHALEEDAGERLLHTTGGLETGPGAERNAGALAAAGEASSWMSGEEVAERWPALRRREAVRLLFQEDAGVVMAAATVAAQARLARESGAEVRGSTAVDAISVDANDGGVEVRTGDGTERAEAVVVAAGAWAGNLLRTAGIEAPLRVTQEQVHYVAEGTGGALPSLIEWTDPPEPPPYLVPDPTEPGVVKIAHHAAIDTVTADSRTFDLAEDRTAAAREVAERWLAQPGEQVRADTCLYTNTPDEDFILDRRGPVVVVSPCSGHGFKFTPLIGLLAAQLATGTQPAVPLNLFGLGRFETC
jgi:sarcosine oxidase